MVGGGSQRPTHTYPIRIRPPPCNEPGDSLRWWSIARVTVSNRQRRYAALASPYGRGAQCAHWAERAFPYRNSPLSRLRRQLSQRESQVGGAFRSWVRFGWVHPFRKVSPFLIRPGFAGPPSPPGEGFGAVELGGCRGKPTWSAGACPRPTKGTSLS